MTEYRYVPTESASEPREMRWQVAVSILLWVASVVFVLLFVAFVAPGLTLVQSIVVIVALLLGLGGLFVAMWAHWGMLHSRRVA